MKEETEFSFPNRRAFDNWRVAGPLPRMFAFAIDGLCGALLVWGTGFISGGMPHSSRFLFLWILCLWAWEGLWITFAGTTPGRRLFKISVYSPRHDGIPHPIQVCLRIMSFWISVLLFGTGLTPILFRRDRRGWHDLISETITIGPFKQMPSPVMQKTGQALLLVQSLSVFSFIGAVLLSTGTGHFSFKDQKLISSACDSRELFLNNSHEVLAALTISPAWHDCFSRLQTSLGPLADSQLSRLAGLANHYFELWTLDPSLRDEFYSSSIRPLEDELCQGPRSFEDVCKTARGLASVSSGNLDQTTWFGSYNVLVKTIAQETDASTRILFIKKSLLENQNPIILSALTDRLFAEELANGQHPSYAPSSWNFSWNEQQQCWLEALGYANRDGSCNNADLIEAVRIIRNPADLSIADLHDQTSRLDLEEWRIQFDLVIEAQSLQPEQKRTARAGLPELSPLRTFIR